MVRTVEVSPPRLHRPFDRQTSLIITSIPRRQQLVLVLVVEGLLQRRAGRRHHLLLVVDHPARGGGDGVALADHVLVAQQQPRLLVRENLRRHEPVSPALIQRPVRRRNLCRHLDDLDLLPHRLRHHVDPLHRRRHRVLQPVEGLSLRAGVVHRQQEVLRRVAAEALVRPWEPRRRVDDDARAAVEQSLDHGPHHGQDVVRAVDRAVAHVSGVGVGAEDVRLALDDLVQLGVEGVRLAEDRLRAASFSEEGESGKELLRVRRRPSSAAWPPSAAVSTRP